MDSLEPKLSYFSDNVLPVFNLSENTLRNDIRGDERQKTNNTR